MLETALMALIGLVIGVFLGWLVALYFNAVGFSYPGMEESRGAIQPSGQDVSQRHRVFHDVGAVCRIPVLPAGFDLSGTAPVRLQPVEAMRAV